MIHTKSMQYAAYIDIKQKSTQHRAYRMFVCYNKLREKRFSERRRIRTFDRLLRRQVLYPAELCVLNLSGWQDSNLRPPAPKAGAITELRYTPKKQRRDRDSNPGDGYPSTD